MDERAISLSGNVSPTRRALHKFSDDIFLHRAQDLDTIMDDKLNEVNQD